MQGILQITSKDFINSNTKYHLLSLQVRIHYNLYSRNDPKDHLPWIYSSLLRLSQRSLELAGFHCRRFGVTNMTRKTTRYIASENLTNLLLNLSILLFFFYAIDILLWRQTSQTSQLSAQFVYFGLFGLSPLYQARGFLTFLKAQHELDLIPE